MQINIQLSEGPDVEIKADEWQAYEPNPIAKDLNEALQVIDADQYSCFFG
jgi:hypothetical protein